MFEGVSLVRVFVEDAGVMYEVFESDAADDDDGAFAWPEGSL